jgi:hypothetical protein
MNGVTRDRSIDAVRALAIAGVVSGHWLVTGLVLGPDGALRQVSPLASMPWFAPISWVLETLGLFFFAGGYAAARAAARRAPTGGSRTAAPLAPIVPARLVAAAASLAGAWAVALAVAAAAGTPAGTLRTIALLVVSPLWFLLPYLALSAATPLLVRLVDRCGPAVAAAGAGVVALTDLALLPGWAAVPAAWSVPWLLGVALARGRLGGARTGAWLAVAGVAALALLVTVAHYPASAVGVPGSGRSNLNPPSLFAIALAAAQIGLFLLVREPLRRLGGTPVVAGLNAAALRIYLSHQSVLVGVAAAAALVAPAAPGLLSAPDGAAWAALRLAWLPVLATVLAVVVRFRLIRTGGNRHADALATH